MIVFCWIICIFILVGFEKEREAFRMGGLVVGGIALNGKLYEQ